MKDEEEKTELGQALIEGLDEALKYQKGEIELNVTERDTEDEKDEE